MYTSFVWINPVSTWLSCTKLILFLTINECSGELETSRRLLICFSIEHPEINEYGARFLDDKRMGRDMEPFNFYAPPFTWMSPSGALSRPKGKDKLKFVFRTLTKNVSGGFEKRAPVVKAKCKHYSFISHNRKLTSMNRSFYWSQMCPLWEIRRYRET